MKRLLTYLRPHKWVMTLATFLVLGIIMVELYRPIIIGNAIDDYINDYAVPFRLAEESDRGSVAYGNLYLTRDGVDLSTESPGGYFEIFLYQDSYYMAESLTAQEAQDLADGDNSLLASFAQTSQLLDRDDLKTLRAQDFNGILQAAALYLVMLLLGFVLNAANTWMLQKMGQNIVYQLREEVFSHIQGLSSRFFDITPVGKLVTRVSNDTEAVNEMFSTILVKLFKNLVLIIGYGVVMVSINPRMALYSFLLLPIVTALTFLFRSYSRKAYQITRTKITEVNTFLSEHISGMKLIQIFAREKEKYQEFEVKSHELYLAHQKEVLTFAVFRPAVYLVSILAKVIVIGAGSYFVLDDTLSLGTLYVFITYIGSFFEPIQELAEQFGTLQSSIASAEKIFSILDVKQDVVNPCGDDAAWLPQKNERGDVVPSPKPEEVSLRGEIEFRNVWFAYEKEDYVLKDISFTIHPGDKIAFVGATGAGKSSILNLIGRYYDIQKGQILVDGIDIKDYNIDVLRGAIGQVQQDVFLFTGDIKSNISLGKEDITTEVIRRSAETVHADSFIERMPEKYEAPVTERGSTLSTGQRQLISFARTLAYQPSILVLDEATANIDTETEGLITHALETLMEGRTTIMVAHRLSTIQHADKIFVMHHGRIQESGSHQELLRQNGLYKKLYELQLVET